MGTISGSGAHDAPGNLCRGRSFPGSTFPGDCSSAIAIGARNRAVWSDGNGDNVPNALLVIKELLETGKLVPVIDKCYPLGETAEAVRYFINELAHGKVVATA